MKKETCIKDLIVGKEYNDFEGCKALPEFTIEPCVGGMVAGVQQKWRVRFKKEGEDRVLVVMIGIPFSICENLFLIDRGTSGTEEYTISAIILD